MIRIRLRQILLALFFLGCTWRSNGQEHTIDVTGQIFSEETGDPIPQVNLYILRNKTGTSTDADGRFFLRVWSSDTVIISSIATEPDTLTFSSEMGRQHRLVWTLRQRVYTLGEVEVLGIGAYDRLKQKLIAMEQRMQSTERPFVEEAPTQRTERPEQVAPTLQNPVELLYEIFGSKPRQLRELEKLQEQDAYRRALALRFRPEIVSALTGLRGEPLADFMNLCRFSPNFVFKASDYEFYMAILDYYSMHQLRMR